VRHISELTEREREVVSLLCALPYRTQQEIAVEMGIEYRTLRTHVTNLLGKLDLPDTRCVVATELHRQLDTKGVTMIERAGTRRLAIVTIKDIIPLDVHEAIVALNLGGDAIFALSLDVQEILKGLEVED
jgi:DNA-binding CsgD family transcriptional regulator